MRLIESLKKKKFILFNIFFSLYIGINLIGGERGLVSYFEKNKTFEELKKKEDHYAALAEGGEPILVVKPDGNKYLMVPQKPDDLRHLWDHDDGA